LTRVLALGQVAILVQFIGLNGDKLTTICVNPGKKKLRKAVLKGFSLDKHGNDPKY
jgi:hypothetical protein